MTIRNQHTSDNGANGDTQERIEELEQELARVNASDALLNRVRAKVWSMKSPDDILPLVWSVKEELETIGIPFMNCGINIVDDINDPHAVHIYNFLEEVPWSEVPSPKETAIILEIWKKGETAYRRNLAEYDKYDEMSMFEAVIGKQVLSVVDVPFSHGTFAISSTEPEVFSPFDIQILERIAEVLGEGFTRRDDITKLESYTAKLEEEIRERKAAELALAASEKRYRELFNRLTDAVIVHSLENDTVKNILEVNDAAVRIFGYSREELLSKPAISIIQKEFRDRIPALKETVREKGGGTFETVFVSRDGHSIPVEMTSFVFKMNDQLVSLSSIHDISERKEAEEAIRRSEFLYRTTIDSMSDAIHVIDRDMKVILHNRELEMLHKRFGLSMDIEGKHLEDLYPFHPKNVFDDYRSLFSTTPEVPVEKTQTIQIQDSFFEVREIPIIDMGVVERVMTVIRDVTDKKKTEELLRQSEEKLRLIITSTNDFMYTLDRNMRYNGVYGHAMEIWGVDESYFLGKTQRELIGDDDSVHEEANRLALRGERVVYEWTARFTVGNNMYYQTSVVPLWHEDEIIGILGVGRDITDYKIAEQALRASEKKYRSLTENAPVGIISIDLNGTIVEINKKLIDLLGSRSVETTKTINILTFPLLVKSGIANDIKRCIDERKVIASSKYYTSLWSKRLFLRYTLAPIYDVEGAITGVQGIFEDISEQKRLEEQAQIRQRMDSLGVLAGGIAHDFNNILAGIMGNLDLILMDADSLRENHRNYIREAYETSRHAAKLVKDFQTLTTRSISEVKSIDIHEIARDVFSLLERTTDKLIEKRIAFEPEKFYVKGQAGQLHQLILNLGTNAAHAITAKGVSKGDFMEITAAQALMLPSGAEGHSPDDYIHITFSDSGIGMSDEVKVRIFEPLFTTKERGTQKGQGLGLAMVYNIVTMNHNGFIDVDSIPGSGTTFNIYLPKGGPTVAAFIDTSTVSVDGTETILILEDEKAVRTMLQRALERFGYSVYSASNGEEGLEILSAYLDIIDLIVLDLTMPVMSGGMFLEKALKINPDVRVIISSGHSEKEHEKYINAKGMITKPYQIEDILRLIRKVLDE